MDAALREYISQQLRPGMSDVNNALDSELTGRMLLTSFHGVGDGRPTYRCPGGRMTRRVS